MRRKKQTNKQQTLVVFLDLGITPFTPLHSQEISTCCTTTLSLWALFTVITTPRTAGRPSVEISATPFMNGTEVAVSEVSARTSRSPARKYLPGRCGWPVCTVSVPVSRVGEWKKRDGVTSHKRPARVEKHLLPARADQVLLPKSLLRGDCGFNDQVGGYDGRVQVGESRRRNPRRRLRPHSVP